MALDRTVEYTVEQAVALLSGKISLQALNSTSKPVQRYCADMFNSKDFWKSRAVNRYYQQIANDLWQGELRAVDYQVLVKIPTEDNQYRTETIKQDKLTGEFDLSVKTRINKSELRHWVASRREVHSFLMNHNEISIARGEGWDAGKQAFLLAEGFDEDSASQPVEVPGKIAGSDKHPDSTDLPHRLADIQALLDGTHKLQAEELRIALQAWLETVEHNRHEQSKNPKRSSTGPDLAA